MRQLVEEVRKLGIVEQAACTTTHQKAAARDNTHSKQQELTAVLKHKVREGQTESTWSLLTVTKEHTSSEGT